MAVMEPSKQDRFAENLKGDPMGIALYHPLPLKQGICDEGNVGDVAFFKNDGRYQWVSNAFCSEDVPSFNLKLKIEYMRLSLL